MSVMAAMLLHKQAQGRVSQGLEGGREGGRGKRLATRAFLLKASLPPLLRLVLFLLSFFLPV